MPQRSRGFRNHYRSQMPWTEVLTKDLRSILEDAASFIVNGGKLPSMVVYPDYPSKKTTIFKIANALRFRITNKRLRRPDLVLWFHDTTHASSALLVQSYPNARVINAQCTDISKTKVDQLHADIFGYSTFIDPLQHHGPAVEKSDINALHDGSIITCPIAQPNGKAVYQLVIDNSTPNGEFLDYRVPVIGGRIPLIYGKYKRNDVRFTNDVHRSEMLNIQDTFSAQELRLIQTFALKMGADFCELDVLRDNASGRIYIIDVNKTPYGPPKGLGKANTQKAVRLLTHAFRDAFMSA